MTENDQHLIDHEQGFSSVVARDLQDRISKALPDDETRMVLEARLRGDSIRTIAAREQMARETVGRKIRVIEQVTSRINGLDNETTFRGPAK